LCGDVVDADSAAGSEGQVAGSIAVGVARTRLILRDGAVFTDSGSRPSGSPPSGDVDPIAPRKRRPGDGRSKKWASVHAVFHVLQRLPQSERNASWMSVRLSYRKRRRRN
jgi:hypothetical protein